jgi:hypothetical protein
MTASVFQKMAMSPKAAIRAGYEQDDEKLKSLKASCIHVRVPLWERWRTSKGPTLQDAGC